VCQLEVLSAETADTYGPQIGLKLKVMGGEHEGHTFMDYANRDEDTGQIKQGSKAWSIFEACLGRAGVGGSLMATDSKTTSERPPEERPDETGGLEREAYLEERKTLVEAEGEASQSLDKALITLSAGAFGLSLLFISRIASEPQALLWLYVAWGDFVLSLVAILSSFLASQKAFRRALEMLDEDYKYSGCGQESNSWSKLTAGLTVTSISAFIVGVVTLAVFATRNLS
jgi:hypothetical protein